MKDVREFALRLVSDLDVAPQSELTGHELKIIAEQLMEDARFSYLYDEITEIACKAYIQRIKELGRRE